MSDYCHGIPAVKRPGDVAPPSGNTDSDRLVRLRKIYDDATHRIAELERSLYRQSRKADDMRTERDAASLYRAKWQQTAIDRRRELDNARATLARVEALIDAWVEGYPSGQYASAAVLACVTDLRAALAAAPTPASGP